MQVFVVFQEPHGLTKCDRGDNIEGEELGQPRKVDRTEIGFGRGIVLADEFEEAGELIVDALFQVEVLFPGVLYSQSISLCRVKSREKGFIPPELVYFAARHGAPRCARRRRG